MNSLKEALKLQFTGLVVTLNEWYFAIKNWFGMLPKWQSVLLIFLIIIILPAYLLSRFAYAEYLVMTFAQKSLIAHPAYSTPSQLEVKETKVIKNPSGTYSAYAVVINPNLDLAIENLKYQFKFYNNQNQQVATQNGTNYMLPDEKKWIVASRIESKEQLASAEIIFENPVWQKRLSVPEVKLRLPEPVVFEQVNPLSLITEGSVLNQSDFAIRQIRLVMLLRNNADEIIGVVSREENNLQPYERRGYKLSWPGLYQSDVKRIELQGYTNTLDSRNIFEPQTNR